MPPIDPLPYRPCTRCGRPATVRWEHNPPDASTEVFRWWCDDFAACYAAWSTNQPATVRVERVAGDA
jgi:hypothetical protein